MRFRGRRYSPDVRRLAAGRMARPGLPVSPKSRTLFGVCFGQAEPCMPRPEGTRVLPAHGQRPGSAPIAPGFPDRPNGPTVHTRNPSAVSRPRNGWPVWPTSQANMDRVPRALPALPGVARGLGERQDLRPATSRLSIKPRPLVALHAVIRRNPAIDNPVETSTRPLGATNGRGFMGRSLHEFGNTTASSSLRDWQY